MARVSITTDAVKATQTADIVIEAIAEDIKLKLKLFAELDAAAPAYVVVVVVAAAASCCLGNNEQHKRSIQTAVLY